MKAVGTRLLMLVPVLFLVSLTTSLMLEAIPGDPALIIVGENFSPERYQEVREQLGLNRPILDRYWDWLSKALHGDLGRGVVPPVKDVSGLITSRLPVTLQITGMAMVMALLIAIPVGMVSAYRAGKAFDRSAGMLLSAFISLPAFLLALLLIFFQIFHKSMVAGAFLALALLGIVTMIVRWYRRFRTAESARERRNALLAGIGTVLLAALATWFAYKRWPTFPRQGFVRLTDPRGVLASFRSAFLPALTLALIEAAVLSRLLRSDMISTLQEDYILSARAKGMPTWRILVQHALRPSSFSLITVAGLSIGRLIGGAVIVEQIFRLPGIGTTLIEAITFKDYPIVQGCVLVIAVLFVLINALVDVLYAVLDPRIRRRRAV